MALENKVANLIKLLSEKEKTFFAITCIERIVELYKQFDLAEDISEAEPSIPKGEAYKTLLSILNS
ncbi:MAG: hypothetical protein IPN43_09395 [Chitinophagaceae bacterium]|nr:hypothetical protein [Chitinophagaceae bacterium]